MLRCEATHLKHPGVAESVKTVFGVRRRFLAEMRGEREAEHANASAAQSKGRAQGEARRRMGSIGRPSSTSSRAQSA
eukprot:scaffold65690_cov29-Tisochrysis_lutea.AAC.8